MTTDASRPWQPTLILDYLNSLGTSMRTLEVTTDAGRAYIKALGNPEGPHALACEWVATHLARWLGLQTFECAIVQVGPWNELPFFGGGSAGIGPAFATRAETGNTWGGAPDELKRLDNPLDLTRLIVFDTWVRNCDRYSCRSGNPRRNYDNVFFRTAGATAGRAALVAMDHSHCFTCGEPLSERLASIDIVKDSSLYGAFPQFYQYFDPLTVVECQEKLRALERRDVEDIIRILPREWEVSAAAREALISFIVERADYVSGRSPGTFMPCPLTGPEA